MNKFKNQDWDLASNVNPSQIAGWQQVEVAVLMDIRDELKKINRILNCPNFLEVPSILRRVSINTEKPKRKKKTKPNQ